MGCICIVTGFMSCTKQAPQLPTNKIVVDNSNTQTMLAINQDLAVKEDSILRTVVAKMKDKAFTRDEIGFWYKIEKAGNGGIIEDKSTCSFSYKLLLTDGKQIGEGKKEIVIGKKEIVTGLEEGIKRIHRGDSATFIIPWYLAYGMTGNKPLVQPYTSIIYQIRVDD